MQTLKPAPVTMIGGLITAVTDNLDDTYDCTIGDGDAIVVITDASLAPVEDGFAYYLAGKPGEQHDPTWLHLTVAEVAKWL